MTKLDGVEVVIVTEAHKWCVGRIQALGVHATNDDAATAESPPVCCLALFALVIYE